MRITAITLRNFRNHEAFDLDDLGTLTLFTGQNGIGKTNILEAIALLTSAQSFRHGTTAQFLMEGKDDASVSASMTDGNRLVQTELLLEPGKKRYRVNGKAKAVADVRGVLPAVAFTPDDLDLAKGSSSIKRDTLDDLGVQLTANYSIVRRDFEKIIRYKNRLLKDEAPQDLIDSINETLIMCGSQLFVYRTALMARLLPLISENHRTIAAQEGSKQSSEELTGRYRASWHHLTDSGEVDLESVPSRDEVRSLLAETLQEFGARERERHRSLVGPHNDKIDLYLDDRPVSDYASQGQQRSMVLAWKLAEVEMVRQSLGVSPVLLLDDVMSELDTRRRDMLVRFVTDDIQTFITATDLSGFNESLLARARIVEL